MRVPQSHRPDRSWLGDALLIGVLAVTSACATVDRRGPSAGTERNWPTYNGSYAGDRFSQLGEITSLSYRRPRSRSRWSVSPSVSSSSSPPRTR